MRLSLDGFGWWLGRVAWACGWAVLDRGGLVLKLTKMGSKPFLSPSDLNPWADFGRRSRESLPCTLTRSPRIVSFLTPFLVGRVPLPK